MWTDLLITSVQNSVDHLILGLDELSLICSQRRKSARATDEHINTSFLIWLSDMLTSCFLDNFIVDGAPPVNGSVTMCAVQMLNTLDELDGTETEPIGVNIGGCVFKPSLK